MKCYLCDGANFEVRAEKVRDNDQIKVIECLKCGLVSLSRVDHISERHYEDGKMHTTEVSVNEWLQESDNDDLRRFEMFKSKLTGKSILDFGCGNGGFLIKALPFTKIAEGVELEERLQPFFKSQGLKVWQSLNELSKKSEIKFDLITSFHVFEHISNPSKVLSELAELLSRHGEIIIEVPSSNDALLTLYKNKAFENFTYWSQHLFLFNQHTMSEMIKKAGLTVNWVKQVQRYSLANHLYWLANGKPGGHKAWSFFADQSLNEAYAGQLAAVGKCDTIMASIIK